MAILASCASQDQAVTLGESSDALIANNALLRGTSLSAMQLALTFDDGPGPRTGELSTYLKNQGIPAVFFMNGRHLATPLPPLDNNADIVANPAALLAQMRADGHLIANHSTTHGDLTLQISQPNGASVVYQELFQTDNSISAYVPPRTFLFRAPYGYWNQADFDAVKLTPMNKYVGPIFWEIGGTARSYPNAGADWACWQGQLYTASGALANGTGYATTVQCSNAYIAEINRLGKGIVLMHDPYRWAQGSTVDMVKDMVPKLKALGYSFVRVDKIPQILTALGCDTTCATCSGTQADECTTCKPDAYVAGSSCTPCTACAATEYETVACSAAADTVCAACTVCAAGTFQEAACTATADAVCTRCDATCTTCTGPRPADCNACLAGSYKAATGCLPCSKCMAGTTQTAACGPAADTVCAACPPGTDSDGTGPCVPVAVDGGTPDASRPDSGPGSVDAATPGTPGSVDAAAPGSVDAAIPGTADAATPSTDGPQAEPPPGDGCSTGGRAPASPFTAAAFALAFTFALGRRRGRRGAAE